MDEATSQRFTPNIPMLLHLHGIRFLGWFALVASLPAFARAQDPTATPEQPNIVVLIADDLGYGETGFQGNPQIPTPNLDALARGGVRCSQGYVTASFCSPSRAALFTGRHQSRFGYEKNPVGAANLDPANGLPPTEKSLAEVLQRNGYATALIGKWHLGGTAAYHPRRRGFDRFWGFLHEGHFYVPGPPYDTVYSFLRRGQTPQGSSLIREGNTFYSNHLPHNEPAYDDHNPLLDNETPITEPRYLTQALTAEATKSIRDLAGRPFLLAVAYNAVHSPMQARQSLVDALESQIPDLQRRIFAAMLIDLDESVGAIVKELRGANLLDQTLIFFLSDNGGPTRELTSSNAPLRGGKGDLYEGGVRVPFLMHWPARLPGNVTYDQPVSSLDIFATSVAAAKVPAADLPRLDGVDLLPYVTQQTRDTPHPWLFWRMPGKTALRQGDWKLLRNGRDQPWELYNLSVDPEETNNLADLDPVLRGDLLRSWMARDQEHQP